MRIILGNAMTSALAQVGRIGRHGLFSVKRTEDVILDINCFEGILSLIFGIGTTIATISPWFSSAACDTSSENSYS
jgi:hypothetical protein